MIILVAKTRMTKRQGLVADEGRMIGARMDAIMRTKVDGALSDGKP